MIKPDKADSSTTLKGLDYIDVAGLSKREYKLNFYSHKEGTFSAKVSEQFDNLKTAMRRYFVSLHGEHGFFGI